MARQGYVNLLPVQQKRSQDPGIARRWWLPVSVFFKQVTTNRWQRR
ncbi:putative RNA methyltransferase [Vreelandella azerica]|nr:hypothetical protein [Halomonas azerica]